MAFMVRHLLSRGFRTRLAAGLGGFSTQIVGSSARIAWSAFGHASVATGAMAVRLRHSRRGLRPRRGGRRRRRRSPQRGARHFLRGRKCGTPPGRGPFVRLVSKEGRSLQVQRLCETFGDLLNP